MFDSNNPIVAYVYAFHKYALKAFENMFHREPNMARVVKTRAGTDTKKKKK